MDTNTRYTTNREKFKFKHPMFHDTSNVIDCNGRKQTLAFSCPFCKEKDNNFSFCELSSELGCNGPTSSTAKLSSGLPVASICTTTNEQIFQNDLSSIRKEAILGMSPPWASILEYLCQLSHTLTHQSLYTSESLMSLT